MSKNERKKAGLHKDISSIFKGVVIPQKDQDKESSGKSISVQPDYTVPKQMDTESQKDEVTKPYQAVQTLSNVEPIQESKVQHVEEPKFEPVEEPKAESDEESKVEPVHESKAEPVEEPKVELIEESKVEPVEETKAESDEESKVVLVQESEIESFKDSEAEPDEESKAEQVHTPKFLTAQESEVESFIDSKAEPAQETEEKSASPPKFMTAPESKVIPIEESEVMPTQENKDKPLSSPKFVTAPESKVIPIEESELEPAQEPENEPARQSKFKITKKPKVIPVHKPQKVDIGNISKKVSKKRSVVKVGGESSWKKITSKLFTAKPGANGTKQKAMVVIVPVLFIVLVIFVFRGGVFGTNVHNAQAGEENNNSAVVPAGLDNKIDWEIPDPYPTTLRDPMQLGPVITGTNQTETNELVNLVVSGILCSEDNSSAIIGNRIVHEGEQIQGATVIKISQDGVEFEMNGKKWTQKVQR